MFVLFPFIYHLWLLWLTPGVSKGVGFIRFDQRNEAERAIQELNGKVPKGCTDPITVKFANNPSNNAKAMPPLAAYLTPQARRFAAGALPAGRFRLDPLRDFSINPYFCPDPQLPSPSVFVLWICTTTIYLVQEFVKVLSSGQFPPNLRNSLLSSSCGNSVNVKSQTSPMVSLIRPFLTLFPW